MAETAALGGNLASGYAANRERDIANRRLATAQKNANKVEKRIAEITNARNIERAANRTRTAVASNIAAQASSGVGSSSAMMGNNAALSSTLSGDVGFMNTQMAGADAKFNYLQKGQDQYNKHMAKAGNIEAIANIGNQAASIFMPTGG